MVIATRIAWIAAYRVVIETARRWFHADLGARDPRGAILVSWSGMRGLVTLATAFALPLDFPGRDLIVLCAFCVVLGTLIIQGLTLRPLLHALDFKDDGTVERELSAARVAIMQEALDSLDGDTSPAAAALRDQYQAARTTAGDESAPQAATEYDRLRLQAINAQRQALHRLRARRGIGDEVFHRLQEELDWSELDASPPGRFQPLIS